MNNPKTIFIHCSATPEGMYFDRSDIDRWHRDRGWFALGYHAIVLLDGTIQIGRDPDNDGDAEEHIGAHVYGHNRDSLGICYIGGVDDDMERPKDTRTEAQRLSLFKHVSQWMDQFDIPLTRIFGHYEMDPGKACPSFDMGEFRLDLQSYKQQPLTPYKGYPILPACRYTLLREGDKGRCVRLAQTALNNWDSTLTIKASLQEDGLFGPRTKSRLRTFQRNHHLATDGIIGPNTHTALGNYL